MPKKSKKKIINDKIPFWARKIPNDEELKQIEEDIDYLHKKHAFVESFNLVQKIKHIPTQITLAQSANYPRLSEKKDQTEEIIKAAEKLRKVLESVALQTKLDINQAPQQYAENGYSNLLVQNGDWQIAQFHEDLIKLERNSRFALQLIPTDPGGRTASSVPLFVTFQLVVIYEEGTKKHATCGDSEDKGGYVGEFYTFLLDIEPTLTLYGIKLGSYDSIGKNAVEAISMYRAIKQELSKPEN